ncbi:hypothetical protein Aperf_G00000059445 [Anoplocephala perfoliata]
MPENHDRHDSIPSCIAQNLPSPSSGKDIGSLCQLLYPSQPLCPPFVLPIRRDSKVIYSNLRGTRETPSSGLLNASSRFDVREKWPGVIVIFFVIIQS